MQKCLIYLAKDYSFQLPLNKCMFLSKCPQVFHFKSFTMSYFIRILILNTTTNCPFMTVLVHACIYSLSLKLRIHSLLMNHYSCCLSGNNFFLSTAFCSGYVHICANMCLENQLVNSAAQMQWARSGAGPFCLRSTNDRDYLLTNYSARLRVVYDDTQKCSLVWAFSTLGMVMYFNRFLKIS